MSVGKIIRTVLGPRFSKSIGAAYRSIFVDLEAVAAALDTCTPPSAKMLDVGAGDGATLDYFLQRRPDVHAIMIDIGQTVGTWLDASLRNRVTVIPSTSLDELIESIGPWRPDVIFLADVLHHIPVDQRERFFASIRRALEWAPNARLVIKDVEPGHWRSLLGLWSDRHITGDRGVQLISRARVIESISKLIHDVKWGETDLFHVDPPNYAIWFQR
jgi:hypothetical protein